MAQSDTRPTVGVADYQNASERKRQLYHRVRSWAALCLLDPDRDAVEMYDELLRRSVQRNRWVVVDVTPTRGLVGLRVRPFAVPNRPDDFVSFLVTHRLPRSYLGHRPPAADTEPVFESTDVRTGTVDHRYHR